MWHICLEISEVFMGYNQQIPELLNFPTPWPYCVFSKQTCAQQLP